MHTGFSKAQLSKSGGLLDEAFHHCGEIWMGGDLGEEGQVAVAPVGWKDCGGDVNPVGLGVCGNEGGFEGEVFLKEVDVEERGRVVGVFKDLEAGLGRECGFK